MKRLSVGLAVLMLCCFYSSVSADIYVWTDEHGVKHFTNYAPPAEAEILMQTEELPYDDQAHKERLDAERQEKLIAAWQDIAEKESQLLEMQQAAELRIEEANRRAQEALQQAESLLNEAQTNYIRYPARGFIHSGIYPYKHRYYNRWYYRKNGGIYYKSPHHKHLKGYHKKHYFKRHRHTYRGKPPVVKPHVRRKSGHHSRGHRSGGRYAGNGRFR